MEVSLFIPVYNSRKLIEVNLRKAYEVLSKLNTDFKIYIIDDNSADKSYRLGPIINRGNYGDGRSLHYLRYTNGPSRRENLSKSFSLSGSEIICFIDADFSCDFLYLLRATELILNGTLDIVTGSRYIEGARTKRSWMRRFFSFLYNLSIRTLFNSKIQDHQCGLKVFRRGSVMPIVEEMGYDHTFTRGWFWDAELLIRAQKNGLKILEMPVEWYEAETSTFKLFRELRCLKSMLKLRFQLK